MNKSIYHFTFQLLEKLCTPEIVIIIAYFQVLDRVYFQDKLKTNAIVLLIQTLNSFVFIIFTSNISMSNFQL